MFCSHTYLIDNIDDSTFLCLNVCVHILIWKKTVASYTKLTEVMPTMLWRNKDLKKLKTKKGTTWPWEYKEKLEKRFSKIYHHFYDFNLTLNRLTLTWTPQKRLPLKSPALLGLSNIKNTYFRIIQVEDGFKFHAEKTKRYVCMNSLLLMF